MNTYYNIDFTFINNEGLASRAHLDHWADALGTGHAVVREWKRAVRRGEGRLLRHYECIEIREDEYDGDCFM